MKLSKKIKDNIKSKIQSIRVKLFATITLAIVIIILLLIATNTVALETYYVYAKQTTLLHVYHVINDYYNGVIGSNNLELELERMEQSNDFDIRIRTGTSSDIGKDFFSSLLDKNGEQLKKDNTVLYSEPNVMIVKTVDTETGLSYILLSAKLDNGYRLYIRAALDSIKASTQIANRFFMIMGVIAMLVGGIIVLFISRKFTEPIEDLNKITKKISQFDFSHKYVPNNSGDEINNLGKNINAMSESLEKNIRKLKESNIELEKDIEEKSRIDEMRKQFISDVSHELKTPISLIQGYAEGLVDNVAEDEESRKFYAEVILDESNKMDILVKKLLELMKLEYGNLVLNPTKFNISELINEVIRKSKKVLEEDNITVNFNGEEMYVKADEFYVEQVFSNYFTNAIKNVGEKDGKKEININYEVRNDKLRISVFNTGEHIDEENLNRIWNRFYKVDTSRNREKGGTGIGLSLVKAIMTHTNNEYGVYNKEGGVEFYFDVNHEG